MQHWGEGKEKISEKPRWAYLPDRFIVIFFSARSFSEKWLHKSEQEIRAKFKV
jgi:hypothetical protein